MLKKRPGFSHPLFRVLLGLLLAFSSFLTLGLFSSTPVLAATRSGADTILVIHGYNPDGRIDCFDDGDYDGFSQVRQYLKGTHDVDGQQRQWGRSSDIRGIGFYKNDSGCTVNLAYRDAPNCNGYMPDGMNSKDIGTPNESIYHISCELAWYIHDEFGTHPGWNIEIVAHSMGGLIIRNAIYQIWKNKAPLVMPSTLGGISDVVTLATPHQGLSALQGIFAPNPGSRQIQEMKQGSYFMNEMQNSAQNPQAARGTDWSLIGTSATYRSGSANVYCDIAVEGHQSTWMKGGRKTSFSGGSGGNGVQCYSHESILKDQNDANNAYFQWADNCNDVDSCSWNSGYGPHSLHHMWNALWHDNW